MRPNLKPGLLALALTLAIPTTTQAEPWQGCYGGVSIGASSGRNAGFWDVISTGQNTALGLLAGGQIGCDMRVQKQFVVGAQASFMGANAEGENFFVSGSGPNDYENYRLHWVGTLTGRAGYLVTESNLVYARGGVPSRAMGIMMTI